jgi:MerR family transcriptional regulator, light-induced transcriptional regulator
LSAPESVSTRTSADHPSALDRLQITIQSEIVPRLLATHRSGPIPPEVGIEAGRSMLAGDVDELVQRLRGRETGDLEGWIEEMLDGGIPAEVIYLDLLAPAARALGTMWEEDTCDFVEVTLALGRMQSVLRRMSHLVARGGERGAPVGRILLAGLPGEQHTLGLIMVAEFFLRAGWEVNLGYPLEDVHPMSILRDEWFDLVGFSVACDTRLPLVKRQIREVRRTSRNRAVRVMVGGRVFDEQPQLVARVGADASAADAREAPRIAELLL